MPILPSLDTRTVLRSESLSDNPVIKDHDGFKLFKPSMQSFIDLIREKKIKEDSLNKLKEQVKNDAKARRYPNLVEKQAKLNHELDKNQRLLKKEIQTVLDNDLLLMEWRRLPQKSFELIDKQTQLAEDLTEEIINEEQAQKIKSLINAEFDIFYSEPVRELYRRDFQAILDVGISEPVLSYLKELSQLDEVMHLEVKKEIDQYQNEQENLRIEKAERIIAKQAQVSSQWIDSVTHIAEDHLACRNEFDEDKRLPVLYSADSAEAVYELLLNGADPVQESKNLDSTPLTQHFASRYVIEQELNRVEHIDIPLLKIQLDSKFDENQLSEKFLEQKKQLKIDLQDKIERLTAEIELQPEFKIEIENQIQELKQETKELKLKLKTDLPNQIKQSKKKVKELPPKLKVELTNQIKRIGS